MPCLSHKKGVLNNKLSVKVILLKFSIFTKFSVFSMFSQFTPCSHIRDGRMAQLVMRTAKVEWEYIIHTICEVGFYFYDRECIGEQGT